MKMRLSLAMRTLFCFLLFVLLIEQRSMSQQVNNNEGVDIFINACRYNGDNHELYRSARFTCERAVSLYNGHSFVARENVILIREGYDRLWVKLVRTYSQNYPSAGTEIILDQDGVGSGQITIEYSTGTFAADVSRSYRDLPKGIFHFGHIRGSSIFYAISLLKVRPTSKNPYHFSEEAIAFFKQSVESGQKELGLTLYQCVGEEKYDDSTAKVIECRKKDGGLLLLVWIDPSKGYVAPLVKIFDEPTGVLKEEYKASNFFKEERTGLWFPAYYEETQYFAGDGYKTLYEKNTYKIDKDSFRLNSKISDEEFTVDIPESQQVRDLRDEKNISIYEATRPGTLTLGNPNMDFDKTDWLNDISSTITLVSDDGTRKPLKPPKTQPVKDSSFSVILRIVFISVGAVMAVAAIVIMIVRRFRAPPMILLLPLLLFVGCNVQPDIPQGKVTVEPVVIDFGQKRPSDSPVKREFKLHNNTDKPLMITDVSSGCGCTAMEYPKEPIAPKATVAVPVKINLLGRFGDFTNKIKVKTDADETHEVDVKGKIVNDLWITESSLRCTAESGQPAKGLLEVHTIDYRDVKFDFTSIDKRLTVTEIARNTADGETVIKFDVAVDTKDDASVSLTLTPLDSKIVPLTIPVYCYSNETPTFAPVLQTKTIALGTVTDRQYEVSVYGDTDLMSVIKQAEFIGSPEGVTVKILTSDKSDVLRLSFQFSDTENQTTERTIKGNVKLTTAGKREWNIPVSGLLRQNGGQNVSQIQQ